MKERPILFSGSMVRAILEGRKTQTRRIAKVPSGFPWDNEAEGLITDGKCVLHFKEIKCQYGTVGDRLWVRETWSPSTSTIPLVRVPKADPRATYDVKIWYAASNDRPTWAETKWRPSIHMPRWASRITLEITGVRVERLQEISDADCRAEGCCHRGWDVTDWKHPHNEFSWNIERANFASLWSSINGPESWSANPWVWVIEFKRLETA